MHDRIKQIVLVVLLLILPLQGLASALTPILCHSDEPQTSVSAQAHGADSSSHEDAPSGHDSQPGTDYSGTRCHHPVGTMPSHLAVVTDSGPSAYTPDIGKASAKITLLAGTERQDAELKPAGSRLEAKGQFKVSTRTKAVAQVSIAGKSSSVRFVLK